MEGILTHEKKGKVQEIVLYFLNAGQNTLYTEEIVELSETEIDKIPWQEPKKQYKH